MTTPEPRVKAPVHVTKIAACDTYWGEPAWAAGCRECGEWIGSPRLTWGGAINDALHHDCAGVRLARKERRWAELLRELEALRDYWLRVACSPQTAPARAQTWNAAAADLTAIIDRAGGTG